MGGDREVLSNIYPNVKEIVVNFQNKTIYTAHNHNTLDKCNDIALFVLRKGVVPVNPFLTLPPKVLDTLKLRKFERLALDMKLLSKCDELWIFGAITYGVGKEIAWWKKNKSENSIKYFDWSEIEAS